MWQILTNNWSSFLTGFWNTILCSVIALIFSLILGVIFALLEVAPPKIGRIIAHIYIEIFRKRIDQNIKDNINISKFANLEDAIRLKVKIKLQKRTGKKDSACFLWLIR